MRDWINLIEGGIANWQVDSDLDSNEAEMMSRFTGYKQEMRHFSTKEKRLIRDPAHIAKVNNTFSKSPVPFSLYFWQSRDPNYDLTSFKGLVDEAWLDKHLGTAADSIKAHTSADAITVVLTNNLSDENKVSLASPWIIAHRIAHALVGDSDTDEAYRIRNMMKNFLERLLTIGYGCEWPDSSTTNGRIFAQDYHEIYGKLMGTMLGTMKSARTDRLTNVYEWWFETVTQYIVRGKIAFNPLPDHFDEDLDLTNDPKKRKIALRMWATFPQRLEAAISEMLHASCGKIFVV